MTQRKSKRCLEFESLESMQLLSGAGAAVHQAMVHHQAAEVHRAPVGDVALNLSGTVRGTYRVVGETSAKFNGRGTVSPIGKTRLQGTLAFSGNGQLTLNFGKRGKVFAAVTSLDPTGGSATYQVTGGTKTFAGDGGTGVAVVNVVPLNAARGRFALSLQGGASA